MYYYRYMFINPESYCYRIAGCWPTMQHNLYFLPHSKTTGPIFTKPSHYVVAFVELLMHASQGNGACRFRTRHQRMKAINFDVWKKDPKLIGYHTNVGLP